MQCPHCATSITPGCRSCPQCGQATDSNAADASLQNADGSSLPTSRGDVSLPLSLAFASSAHDAHEPHASPDVPGLLTQANLHRLRNEWKQATDCCVAVLRAQAGNQTAHSLLGDIYRDQGRLDDAIQWYRMAIELHSNPSDEAKLVRVEGERNQLMAEDAQRQRHGYGPAPASALFAADVDLNAGTVNLMGVSPHRWLRAIWAVSLSFLVVMLIALISMRPAHRPTHVTGVARTVGGGLSPLIQQASGASSTSVPGSLGSIRQDLIASGQSEGAQRPGATEPPPILQTAPVGNVTPLPTNGLVNAPRDPSAGHSGLQPMPLTGGLKVELAQNVGDGTVAVLVSAPRALAGDASDSTRELLLRNIFRAARTALAENGTYTHAAVFIQVPATGDAGEVAIVEATVDRNSATNAKPDSDSVESLTSHVTGFKWSGQNAPPANAPPANAPPANAPPANAPPPPNGDTGTVNVQDSTPPGQ